MPVASKIPLIEPDLDFKVVFSSKLRTARKCLRKYYWEYIRQFESRSLSFPLMVGSAVHYGIELFMTGYRPSRVLSSTEEFIEKYSNNYFLDPAQESELALQTVTTLGILSGYMRHYADDPKTLKTSATEQSILARLPGTSTDAIGTLDLVFAGPRGLAIMDHKAYRALSPGQVENLSQDTQVQLYIWLLSQHLGDRIEGMYFNMIRKPAIRQKKTESRFDFMDRVSDLYVNTPEDYFWRPFVRYEPRHIEAALNDARWWTLLLEQMHSTMTPEEILTPTNWPRTDEACLLYGDNYRCPYWNLCAHGRDGNDPHDQRPFHQRIGHDRGSVINSKGTPA